MNLRFINARIVLALALIRNLLMRLLPGRGGPRAWLGTIAKENLAPTSKDVWKYLAGSSRCIGCGLCDTVGATGEAPSEWIVGAPRQAEDAPLVRDQAARLHVVAQQIARICPAGVPVEDVARIIDENVRMLEQVKATTR